MSSPVSVVIPVYRERDNLAPLLAELEDSMGSVEWEVVAVDDGSDDGSLEELRRLRGLHRRLRIVRHPGNLGQSAAILSGFDFARGDPVVTMDADGQNDPADIGALLEHFTEDGTERWAAVVGYRRGRHDTSWKKIQSRIANRVRDVITGDRVIDTGCSLKAIRKDYARRLPRFDGVHRFIPTLIRQLGGEVLEVPVSHRSRWRGSSKYGAADRALRGLRDSLGVRWLLNRSIPRLAVED